MLEPRSNLEQLKLLCAKLNQNEVDEVIKNHKEYLGKLSEHFILFDYEKCDFCGEYVSSLFEDVESYDTYREDICDECIGYCGVCDDNYAPGGSYKHEDCMFNQTKENRLKYKKRKSEWLKANNKLEEEDESE
jgi:hypothetical protein